MWSPFSLLSQYENRMNGFVKFSVVLAGYVFSLLAAFLVCYLRELQFQRDGVDTSGGMYAWGDLITFSMVFGPPALLTTGAALYFLRRSQKFWTAISISSLPIAFTGLASLLLAAVVMGGRQSIPGDLAFLGILRMYPAPMLFSAFVFCAFLAPSRHYRRLLLGAAAIEMPAALCCSYFIASPFVWVIWHGISNMLGWSSW